MQQKSENEKKRKILWRTNFQIYSMRLNIKICIRYITASIIEITITNVCQ